MTQPAVFRVLSRVEERGERSLAFVAMGDGRLSGLGSICTVADDVVQTSGLAEERMSLGDLGLFVFAAVELQSSLCEHILLACGDLNT